jgi:ABC-2 type transport system ATP-binding protein
VREADALAPVADGLRALDPDPRVDVATRRVAIGVDDGTARLMDTVRLLDALGVAVEDVALRRPTLDEVFLTLTGQCAADAAVA